MSFWKIVLRSLRQHRYSSVLATLSMAIGMALLVAVYSLKEQTHNTFSQVGLGVDAILGPKGSPLQIVLNALYHLEDMPGKIKWAYFKEVERDPLVFQAIPFCVGHSYRGFRVNAIDRRFLTEFEYLPGKLFSFDQKTGGQGRPLQRTSRSGGRVGGCEKPGAADGGRVPSGMRSPEEGDPVHEKDNLQFVGILAPTGTPHDRAIYIPLETFYELSGHPPETVVMAEKNEYREISGAYLKIKRIRGGAIHPGIQGLKFAVNQSDRNQTRYSKRSSASVIQHHRMGGQSPFGDCGHSNRPLRSFPLFSLLSTLRERKRDLALLRSLGAARKTVMGLVISEALIISFLGGLIGLGLGHGLTAVGALLIKAETGVGFTASYVSLADWLVLPAVLLLGFLAGLVPGLQAYRLGILRSLSPLS